MIVSDIMDDIPGITKSENCEKFIAALSICYMTYMTFIAGLTVQL